MDDTLRARLLTLTDTVRRLKSDCEAHFWKIGAALSEVRRSRLYLLGGYDDMTSYLAQAVSIERNQANKWMAVAENFSEARAAETGVEKCWAYLRHIAATPQDDRPADIDRATIVVPQADGTTVTKLVVVSTVAEIEAATRLVRAAGRPDWPADLAATVDRMQAALGDLGRVKVSMSGDTPTLSISALLPDRMCDAVLALDAAFGCRARVS